PGATVELAEAWDRFRSESGKGEPTKADRLKWLTARGAFEAELVEWAGEKFQADSADKALAVARQLGFELLERREEQVPEAKGPARYRVYLKGRVANPPSYCVRSIERKRTVSRPPAPFITSTLQQSASTRLGYSATRTMRIAQDLYESGYITYMRTDSTNLAPEAVQAARAYIANRYGERYVPERPNRYASRQQAQEAHEAIRPTDVKLDPEAARGVLEEDAWRLYKLIWERFLASQMAPAEFEVITALIAAETTAGDALWKAGGRRVVFDGFMRVAGLSNGEQLLPPLAEAQQVHPFSIEAVQNFTQPPPRYTEASLVRALEAEGIGRPSTYATIIQTIQDRGYVEQINRRFYPTLLGRIVTERLVDRFPQIMDLRFTAQMEDQLDAIQERHLDWVKLLRDFYGPFHQHVEKALAEMEHVGGTPSPYKCDKCGKPMLYRIGKNGFFLSCSGYPECKNRQAVDGQGKPLVREETDHRCPNCGKPMVKQVGRFGPFLGCSGYPECKTILNLDRAGNILPRKPPPVTTDLSCPKCGKPLYLRLGKRGPWLGCSAFPRCRGRASWSNLPEEKRNELLAEL
ncbi:MAG TPA: type I DNA topoisomerase, partial [Planctomycetaceae bacterium]|nr:type I DNA topoisomerase [Planctomycetaceae bacterium]